MEHSQDRQSEPGIPRQILLEILQTGFELLQQDFASSLYHNSAFFLFGICAAAVSTLLTTDISGGVLKVFVITVIVGPIAAGCLLFWGWFRSRKRASDMVQKVWNRLITDGSSALEDRTEWLEDVPEQIEKDTAYTFVFQDLNNNGVWDPGEPWKIVGTPKIPTVDESSNE